MQSISYIRSLTGIQYSITFKLRDGFERREYREVSGKYRYADARNTRDVGRIFYSRIWIGDLFCREECLPAL